MRMKIAFLRVETQCERSSQPISTTGTACLHQDRPESQHENATRAVWTIPTRLLWREKMGHLGAKVCRPDEECLGKCGINSLHYLIRQLMADAWIVETLYMSTLIRHCLHCLERYSYETLRKSLNGGHLLVTCPIIASRFWRRRL